LLSTELCDNRRVKISVVIIAYNEERKIADAIASVKWADEIVVVDSESTDQTVRLAAELGARTIVRGWEGFSRQKSFATKAAANDWVLSLDADERVTDELRQEIIGLKGRTSLPAGFRIPRLSFYMNRPIKHGGWYPDRQLRLFDRRLGSWNDRWIHESFEVSSGGTVESLQSDILHFSVDGPAHHHRMIGERYAPLAAKQMFASGRTTSPARIAAASPAAFIRSYFLKLGFLDGLPGLAIAKFAGHHAFLKHLLLWEMQNRRDEVD